MWVGGGFAHSLCGEVVIEPELAGIGPCNKGTFGWEGIYTTKYAPSARRGWLWSRAWLALVQSLAGSGPEPGLCLIEKIPAMIPQLSLEECAKDIKRSAERSGLTWWR